jgi:hypothetical protein
MLFLVLKNLKSLFDESLSGKDQVNHVIRQVYLRLKQLYHFSRLPSSSIMIKLVKSVIFPIFDYGDGVFCGLSAGFESKLTKALNNSIRFICNLGRFSEVSRYRLELCIFKPFVKRRLNLRLLLYKIFNIGEIIFFT